MANHFGNAVGKQKKIKIEFRLARRFHWLTAFLAFQSTFPLFGVCFGFYLKRANDPNLEEVEIEEDMETE